MKFLRISPFILVLLAASMSILPMGGVMSAQEATTVPEPATQEATTVAEPVAWAYNGANGPDHWGDLSDQYATCAQGKAQSPIDIRATPGTDRPISSSTINRAT